MNGVLMDLDHDMITAARQGCACELSTLFVLACRAGADEANMAMCNDYSICVVTVAVHMVIDGVHRLR